MPPTDDTLLPLRRRFFAAFDMPFRVTSPLPLYDIAFAAFVKAEAGTVNGGRPAVTTLIEAARNVVTHRLAIMAEGNNGA